MSKETVRAALVLDTNSMSYDDVSLNVIDLQSIMPVGTNLYLIRTNTFDNTALKNGAGTPFTQSEIQAIISSLSHF